MSSSVDTRVQRGSEAISNADLGVGMRISVHPHSDDFVDVILGALDEVKPLVEEYQLTVDTDDVSTYVGAEGENPEQRLAQFATSLIAAAERRSENGHIVAHLLFSRGCPGSAGCDLKTAVLPATKPVVLESTGVSTAAHWSLYPLLDADSPHGDHLPHVEAAIERASKRGVDVSARNFATRLAGDLSDVIATIVDSWSGLGEEIPHVVTHASLSVNSPSEVDA